LIASALRSPWIRRGERSSPSGVKASRASTHVVADLQRLPPPQPFDRLAERLERNPDFLLLASESRLRTAELRLTQAQSRPSLHIGAGLRRLEAPDDIGLVAAFSLPLQVAGRNRAAIAEAEARVSLNDAQREAALVRARATALRAAPRARDRTRRGAGRCAMKSFHSPSKRWPLIDEGFRLGRLSYLELGTGSARPDRCAPGGDRERGPKRNASGPQGRTLHRGAARGRAPREDHP
jgi:hypothetical protein